MRRHSRANLLSMNDFRKLRNGGELWMSDDAKTFLPRLDLESIRTVVTSPPGQQVSSTSHRAVHRVAGEGNSAVYLKVSRPPSTRLAGLKAMLRRQRSSSRVEAENAWAIMEAGVDVAAPIAVGEVMKWGQERASFLATRQADGMGLSTFFREGRRLTSEDAGALCSVLRSLFDAGLYPRDLVPKHLYLDRVEGISHWCLIDMFRMERGRPNDQKLMSDVLARLSAQTPQYAVSQVDRLRLLRSLFGKEARTVWRRISEHPQARRERRRLRRFLRTRPLQDAEKTAPLVFVHEGLFVDRSLLKINADLRKEGVAPGDRLAKLSATLEAQGRQVEHLNAPARTIRTLVDATCTLAEFVDVSRVLAATHSPTDRSEGWVLRAAHCQRGCPLESAPIDRSAGQLSRLLSAMLRLKIFPQERLFQWFLWSDDVPRIAPLSDVGFWTDFRPSGEQKLRAQIAEELKCGGWSRDSIQQFDRGLQLCWPQYLGQPIRLFGENQVGTK